VRRWARCEVCARACMTLRTIVEPGMPFFYKTPDLIAYARNEAESQRRAMSFNSVSCSPSCSRGGIRPSGRVIPWSRSNSSPSVARARCRIPRRWAGVLAGLVFMLLGATVIIGVTLAGGAVPDSDLPPGTPFGSPLTQYAVGRAIVGLMTAIFGCVAFGPGTRQFRVIGVRLVGSGGGGLPRSSPVRGRGDADGGVLHRAGPGQSAATARPPEVHNPTIGFSGPG
jgi:hypothetical protein